MHQGNRLPRWLLPALVASLSVVLMSAALLYLYRPARPGNIGVMPTFELTNQAGKSVYSADLKGKLLVISLIYTECTDICPITTIKMRELQDRLRTEGMLGSDALLLSITVDPERDTPEVLAQYATEFGADTTSWHFLTGQPDYVRKVVVEGLLLGYDKTPPTDHPTHGGGGAPPPDQSYEVSHSDRVLLVDRHGIIRAIYAVSDLDLDKITTDMRRLK